MARFFAMTSRGLVDVLRDELEALGLTHLEKVPGGVFFESNWEGCYLANLWLRSATRVVLPILDFPAYEPDELYHNVLKHDFTKYISKDQTLAVVASVRDGKMHDQRFVALKIKDAIVDQFREKYESRPNVDSENPDLRVIANANRNQFSLAIDTSGDPLFKRGYRVAPVAAPLKEHLAAGLVEMTGWNKTTPVVDLMCGSGTFLIEAALMALNVAPGLLRRSFGYERFLNFDESKQKKIVDKALAEEKEELPFKFYGFDIDGKAIRAARTNAEKAGVADLIEFHRSPVDLVEKPTESGIVVVNPPYGQRVGAPGELEDLYKDMAFTLKSKFKGWSAWILSGEPEMTKALKMKSARKFPVYNGPIECRFLHYQIF